MVLTFLRLQQRRFVDQVSFKKFLTEVARDNHAGLGPTPGGVPQLTQKFCSEPHQTHRGANQPGGLAFPSRCQCLCPFGTKRTQRGPIGACYVLAEKYAQSDIRLIQKLSY